MWLLPLAAGGLWWWSAQSRASVEREPDTAASRPGTPAQPGAPERLSPAALRARPAPEGSDGAALGPDAEARDARAEQLRLAELRAERARSTLESYRQSTRYPPSSRPMREHPDQLRPAAPERTRGLRPDSEVALELKQDRVFVAGDEVVRFSVACRDARQERRPVECQVTGGTVYEAEHLAGSKPLAPVPLPFVDDGRQGDEQAGDGVLTASLQPSTQGFPLYSGTLRVSFEVTAAGERGEAFFDIMYTASPPARFTGAVRETVEGGSLHLKLTAEVRRAGRYVVAARVDDAAGASVAYLAFNEELAEGVQQVDLVVFGKLLLDEAPRFPLTLRDVEGFLLKESGDPDRELLATLVGAVHTTRAYSSTAFSSEEWQSEERSRYLERFGEDVKEAEEAIAQARAP